MLRVLVVRNDKIGDFMLAWPSFALLKQSMNCHVTALVPAYTEPLARLCPWIDAVMIDPGKAANKVTQASLLQQIRATGFAAAICFFSNTRNAVLVWRGGIPYRLAPATKLAQVFYNHRLVQRRSRSAKPEYEYNLDLARQFLADFKQIPQTVTPPYLSFETALLQQVRHELQGLDAGRQWIMLHPGSGGSASNLTVEQYASLLVALMGYFPEVQFVLTAGPGEEALVKRLSAQLETTGCRVGVFISTRGLVHFCQVIANAALFIAGSTGPLHIAAALDVPTVGFFPLKRSATALRWKTLNSENRHLAFSLGDELESFNPATVAERVAQWGLVHES